MTGPSLERAPGYFASRFQAMASPCEVLIDTDDESLARELGNLAFGEATRIEAAFSRYRDDNLIARINRANGATVEVDDETAALLDYAETCWRLSEGRFDVTSGILRRVWRFDGSDRLPTAEAVAALLPLIGWDKLRWQRPRLTLRPGMEIDLGGIGKEYAVDRVAQLLAARTPAALLVNFGGDLMTTGARRDGQGWTVGVENPQAAQEAGEGAREARLVFELSRGGVATSGDARRFLFKGGRRYSHILDPRTGWPVEGAPRSVTVVSTTCAEAGILATLAMLHGADAEKFLDEQKVRYWCLR